MTLLANVALFAELTPDQLASIEARCSQRSLLPHQSLMREGDSADALYIIRSGRVKVFVSEDNGKEFIIDILGPGESVGELALLDDETRTASVTAVESCELYELRKDAFKDLLTDYPHIAIQLLATLASRLRHITDNAKGLALRDVYSRVRKILQRMAEPRSEQDRMIPEKLTQQDIADRVGASREMVARILKDLTTGGYISIENRHIVIHGQLPEHY